MVFGFHGTIESTNFTNVFFYKTAKLAKKYRPIIGTIAIACDCCFTITIMRLIACYIFKSKLNILMIFL